MAPLRAHRGFESYIADKGIPQCETSSVELSATTGSSRKSARVAWERCTALTTNGSTGKVATAAKRALELAADSKNLLRRLRVTFAALRVQGLTGEPVVARERLATIIAEAAERGLTTLAFEGRLALGEVDLAAGNPAGRARLEGLERDAERQGMYLVARKAREMIEG